MRLEVALFGDINERWRRMVDVLSLSARLNSPATPLNIRRIDDDDCEVFAAARPTAKRTWIDNARKAKHHNRIIQDTDNWEVIGLLDADAMILRDLSPIEDMDFDIAYTVRPPHCKWKINTGVYFVRVSEPVKDFCKLWHATAIGMLADGQMHDEWKNKRRYGGLHQAAFGWTIENFGDRFKLLPLPCEEWNCVNGIYETAENPRVIHLMKYSMRSWCFGDRQCNSDNAQRFVDKWREYDRQLVVA